MIDNWLTRLLRSSGNAGAQHPIHHLLLMQFLGLKIETLFQFPTEFKPFGSGPWPCLNPASNHYQQLTITECTFIYNTKIIGDVIGTFACYCGFTYNRRGPDTSSENQCQITKVISPRQITKAICRGEIWEAAVQQLWNDPSVSLTKAAAQLGIAKKTLKSQATQLGLRFPKPYKHLRHNSSEINAKHAMPTENEFETNRSIWLAALKEYPGEGIQFIWKTLNLFTLYHWLLKFDSEWLKAHMPPRKPWKKRLSPLPPRVDWEKRDAQLAQRVKASAQFLKNVPGRPKKVSKSAIGRNINAKGLIERALHKLPLTATALSEVAETHEDCGVRRIWWATKLYQQEGIIPSRHQLISRAYVRYMLKSPQVVVAINSALLTLG